MTYTIDKGIKISVKTHYAVSHSVPERGKYIFVYKIHIYNMMSFPVQLLRRHWDISDGYGYVRAVDGAGVVGRTPVIQPNEAFEYESFCDLITDIGCMKGYYTMINADTQEEFMVDIPQFVLVTPYRLN